MLYSINAVTKEKHKAYDKKRLILLLILQHPAVCTQYEHDNIRHRLMFDTGCASYCHCAGAVTHEDGRVEYTWVRVDCPLGTLFNESHDLRERICIHSNQVTCRGLYVDKYELYIFAFRNI